MSTTDPSSPDPTSPESTATEPSATEPSAAGDGWAPETVAIRTGRSANGSALAPVM